MYIAYKVLWRSQKAFKTSYIKYFPCQPHHPLLFNAAAAVCNIAFHPYSLYIHIFLLVASACSLIPWILHRRDATQYWTPYSACMSIWSRFQIFAHINTFPFSVNKFEYTHASIYQSRYNIYKIYVYALLLLSELKATYIHKIKNMLGHAAYWYNTRISYIVLNGYNVLTIGIKIRVNPAIHTYEYIYINIMCTCVLYWNALYFG